MWSLLSRAAEAIAPAVVTPLDELKNSWQEVRDFYADGREDIEEAEVPRHLNDIVQVLLDEEEDDLNESAQEDDGSRGRPCLSFLLKHNIIETLCLIAGRNHPRGIRKIVLATLSTLLRCMRHPLLSYTTVHRPVQQLVEQCLDSLRQVVMQKQDGSASPKPPSQTTSDSPSSQSSASIASVMDDEFVELLVTIVYCLENDKRLIALFCKPTSSGASFPLFDALVTAMPYSTRARKGIQMACELTPSVRAFVAAKKGFLSDVVRLVADEYRSKTSGMRASCLGSAVEFCDALLVYPPHDLLSVNILECVSQELCNQILLPDLLSMRQESAIAATRFLTEVLPKCSARRMQDCLLAFLLGGSVGRWSAAGEDERRGLTLVRMSLLMRMLDSKHPHLQLASAQLISAVLCLNHRRAFESLLVQELDANPQAFPLDACEQYASRFAQVIGSSTEEVQGGTAATTASTMVGERRVAFALWSSPHFSTYPVQEEGGPEAGAEGDEIVFAAAEADTPHAKLNVLVAVGRLQSAFLGLSPPMMRTVATLVVSLAAFPHPPLLQRLFLCDHPESCLTWLDREVPRIRALIEQGGKYASVFVDGQPCRAGPDAVTGALEKGQASEEEQQLVWGYYYLMRMAQGISAVLCTHANETVAAKVATNVFCSEPASA
eukprot:TRINITY_DN9565_c0_g1_i1.p1 TRINITY_DN9565_c0_g1~~TRINITY_DN9565_c0_g1_i1.p1  ORF type:complete len:663 (-),score=142.18 TRINITY_DN9565_c0_g1_i1:63-2051(-)